MVYRVSIPNFDHFLDELSDKVRDGIAGLADWNFRDTESGALELVSGPMNKIALDAITGLLVPLKVQYSVEDLSDQYIHVATTAPLVYDYPYNIDLGFTTEGQFGGKPERHVAVQKERQEYQFGRYSSGLMTWRIVYNCDTCKDSGVVENTQEGGASYCPSCGGAGA